MSKFKDQTPEVKQVIYELACEFGHDKWSTPEEIDYKFWEDVPAEWIAINLSKKLVEARKIGYIEK